MDLDLDLARILTTKRLLFKDQDSDDADLFEVYRTKLRGNQNVRNLRRIYGVPGMQHQWFEESLPGNAGSSDDKPK